MVRYGMAWYGMTWWRSLKTYRCLFLFFLCRKILRKLAQTKALLEFNVPAIDAPDSEVNRYVADMVRIKRRQKALSSNVKHITLVMSTTLDGQPLPYMVIYQSDNDKPKDEWVPTDDQMRDDYTYTVNNNHVRCLFRCSPSGGMTKKLWMEYNREIIIPCIANDIHGKPQKGIHMFDGDFTHNVAEVWEMLGDNGCAPIEIPPHLTHELQLQDAGTIYSTFQTTDLPNAKAEVSRACKKLQCGRDLSFADMPTVMRIAFRSFTKSRLTKAADIVGLYPCTRRVLWKGDIQRLLGEGPSELPKCIDLDRTCFFYDQSLAHADPK